MAVALTGGPAGTTLIRMIRGRAERSAGVIWVAPLRSCDRSAGLRPGTWAARMCP